MAKQINLGNVKAKINNQVVDTITGSNGVTVTTSGNNITLSSPDMVSHINDKNNPHNVTKNQLGLGNVENKSPDDILNEITAADITRALGFNLADKVYPSRVYGFEIDCNESDPESAIRYIGANENYQSAYMDYDNNVFNYGDWINAWFIANLKVVLMKFDGTIYCELDKNDYTKDIDGNTVDISSSNTIGNVMVGIPTVWIKYDITNPMKPKYYFAPVQVDSTYHAYAHTNRKGEIIPYKYLAAYEGWSDGTRMRSISGVTMPTSGNYTTMYPQQQRYQYMNNYTGNDITDDENNWDMEAWCDRMLINLLLLLIGKSTDTQEIFGHGNEDGCRQNKNSAKGVPWNSNSNGVLNTGVMNTKGLFWGANDTGSDHLDYKGVKVFGIEHWWGNIYKWALGWNHVDSTDEDASDTFIKMTPEKVNGVDYIPLPQNNNTCPESGWWDYYRSMWESLESYGYTKYSWFEEENDSDCYMGDYPGIQWKGNQYGLSPYKYPDEGEDVYFPDYAYICTSDNSDPWFCMARCGGSCGYWSYVGAFFLHSYFVDLWCWDCGSFLCSF